MKLILGKVGKKCVFRRHIRLFKPKNIILGNDVMVNRNVMLDGRRGLEIGDSVDIGEYSVIWTLEHDPNDNNFNVKGGKVVIEDYVWITPRCIILPGVTIGRGAVIATGSIITKDVPPMSIVAGNPAKVVGKRKNDLNYTFNNIQIF